MGILISALWHSHYNVFGFGCPITFLTNLYYPPWPGSQSLLRHLYAQASFGIFLCMACMQITSSQGRIHFLNA